MPVWGWTLARNPNAKLAIIAPQLSEIRNQLADLLDDTFHQIRDKTRHQLRATEALATHDRVQDMLNAVGLEVPKLSDLAVGVAAGSRRH